MISFILSQALSFAVPCSYAQYPVRIETQNPYRVVRQINQKYPSISLEMCSWYSRFRTVSKEQQMTAYSLMYRMYGGKVSR